MSALSNLYSRVGSPSLYCLSLYDRFLHDDTNFVTRLWTIFIIILSSCKAETILGLRIPSEAG